MLSDEEWRKLHPFGWQFEIPGLLPTLNDYTRVNRANRFAANKMKQDTEERIMAAIGKAPRFGQPVVIEFAWIRPDMRTDKDNVAFAKKFVLDALQKAGVIPSDRWKQCTPYDRAFMICKSNPRTVVRISLQEEKEIWN